jgi:phospholipid/cholesterol/gamma-HCH transport system permease protein
MAFNPIAYLVVPRLIAGVVMIPVVTIFSTLIAFVAAWLTAINLADLTTYEFFKGAKLFANYRDFALPISKSIIFGATIILISCYQGFRTQQGAEGVGRSATNTVVVICLMILTFDFVMAKFILG